MSKNNKKLEHIQIKDNGIKLSQKIGDQLNDAKTILENEIIKGLVKSKDETSMVRFRVAQNNQMRAFRNKTDELVGQTAKTIKESLKKDTSVNLTNKQAIHISKQINNGLSLLSQNAQAVYKGTVNSIILRCKKADDLKNQLEKHISSGVNVGVVYKDGKHFQFDTYWEMKARTEIQEDIGSNMIKTGNALGNIFYITSYYGDCAKDHADYQGKIYVDKDWESNAPKDRLEEIRNYISTNKIMTVQEVMGAPVFLTTRPNCRHYFQYIDIDSVLGAKTEKEVSALRSSRDLNFNGKYKPDKYKALQKQRLNERNIRAAKADIELQEQLLALNPGDKEIQTRILNKEARVRNIQAEQRDLIKQYGNLERRYDREALGNRVTLGAGQTDNTVTNTSKNIPPFNNSNNTPAPSSAPVEKDIQKAADNFSQHFGGDTKIVEKMVKSANIKDDNVYKIIANVNKLKQVEIAKGKPCYNGNFTIKLSSQNDSRVGFHEFGHSLDHMIAYDQKWETENSKFHWLSDGIEDVRNKAKEAMDKTIPKELVDILDKEKTRIKNEVIAKLDTMKDKAIAKFKEYDNKYLTSGLKKQMLEAEMEKQINKEWIKAASTDKNYSEWASLSDIYDAITDGSAKNATSLTGYHGRLYYILDSPITLTVTGKVEKQNTEIFANFFELKMSGAQEQLDFFKKDQPELYNKLDEIFGQAAKYLEDK